MSWWILGKSAWFSLPIELRRRWWDETDYGKRAPSAALWAAIAAALWPRPQTKTLPRSHEEH